MTDKITTATGKLNFTSLVLAKKAEQDRIKKEN
jgi:hypothetical protein